MSGVLFNKQLWRRQSWSASRRNHDLIYNEEGTDNERQLSRSESANSYIQTNVPLPSHNSMKQVRFSAAVRVILIPTVAEYRQVGLANQMWWTDCDYTEFKQSAVCELRAYMMEHSSKDSKAAIKALYQLDDAANTHLTSTIFSAEVVSPQSQEHVHHGPQQEAEMTPASSDKYEPVCLSEASHQFHMLHSEMKVGSFYGERPSTPPPSIKTACGGSPTCVTMCLYQHSPILRGNSLKVSSPRAVPSVFTVGKGFGSLLSTTSPLRPTPLKVDTRRSERISRGATTMTVIIRA